METDKLTLAVEHLTSEVSRMKSLHNELWGVNEVADFLKISTSSVHSAVFNKKRNPDFPPPVVIPTGGRRWFKNDVIEWAKSRRACLQ
jgi:predicted DNA-binding transcriptional regulator AlpA